MEYAIHFSLPTLKGRNVEFIDAQSAEEAIDIFNKARIKDTYNVSVERRKNVWDSLAKQHGLERYCTGGNCEAYRLTFDDGTECLITDSIDPMLPVIDGDVSVYFYDVSGVESQAYENLDGNALAQWETIDGIIQGHEAYNKCKRIN